MLPKGKFEFKLTPSKLKFEKECTPDVVNKDDKEGSFLGRVEHKIGDDKPDVTSGFKYAMPKVNEDVGLWFEGNVTYKQFKNWVGDIGALASYKNQFYIGSQIKGDLQTQKADEITGVIGASMDNNFCYMHANCLNHVIRLGFSTPNVRYFKTFAAESEIKLKEKGSLQDRTTGKLAFDFDCSNDILMKFKFDITKDILLHSTFKHKINDHLTITMTDCCNPLGFFQNPGKSKYNVGVALEANF